ncbi:CCNB1 protein, partial [Sapayoa aenigma]|nr:CCNB1 protein [Sapayoa aenigma]
TPIATSVCAPKEYMPCQAFSGDLLEAEDLDVEDCNDSNLCSSYVNDIYKYLRHLEEKQPIKCKYLAGSEINENMRAVLIDWLVDIHLKFQLQQETLYLTVAIIDHFLQNNAVPKTKLQLVGVTAILIASKYEEMHFPLIEDLSFLSDHICSKVQIRQMELIILKALDFHLGFPLPPHFLRRASKIAQVDSKQYVLAEYLMELSILDYNMVHFPPSMIAAAAFCLSLKLLDGCNLLPPLQHYMFYTERDLLPVMQHIAKNVVLVNKGLVKQKAIVKKYAMRTNMNISTIEQLHSSTVWDLAEPLVKM